METLKSHSKFFFEFRKKAKNFNIETVSYCQKVERGDPLSFLKLQFPAKYQKIRSETLWRQKNRKKVAQCRKKLKWVVSSNFVSYIEQGVNKRGTLCTNSDAFLVVRLPVSSSVKSVHYPYILLKCAD